MKVTLKKREKHIKHSGPLYMYDPVMAQQGMPDKAAKMQPRIAECGCGCGGDESLHVDDMPAPSMMSYGMAPNGDPDENGDGVYDSEELAYHFDLNGDGLVLPDEYKAHIDWHNEHPEILDQMVDKDHWINVTINEKRDRCYYLAKSKYTVFPSAYASGYIVKCRKGKVGRKKKKR